MGHVYIPGLRVTEYELVRKKRILPLKGEVVVKEGDEVEPDTVVARAFLPGRVDTINVAGLLSVEPAEVESILLKKVGEKFKKDEVLAESKGFFGLFKTQIKAPFDGSVESVSKITGQVILRAEPTPIELKAYIPGVIKEVYPEEGVLVETWATFIQGIFGVGGERYGKLRMLVDSPDEKLVADKIDESLKGAILIGGSLITVDVIEKAKEVGAVGIVSGGIDALDLVKFLGYDLGVAITGSEDIPLTLIVTEGFGEIPMAEKTFKLLKKYDGYNASINGATQIRAGVIRPEIIIKQEEPKDELKQRVTAQVATRGLELGMMVRIIRVPYFGKIGKIVELPPELQQLESETKARVAVVELLDGERVVVPRANIEMLE